MLTAAIGLMGTLVLHPEFTHLFPVMIGVALVFGIMLVTPIGGADMPTVISLLNSYAGFSAALLGFVLNSKVLVVAGALDGASGFILSVIMCKAMNRSFTNVLFGGFGQIQTSAAGAKEERPVRSATPEEAAAILAAANKVVIVPGYGMAVAQAQHKVRELYDILTKRGIDVKFGIHPVAGRMPGHMNVLLAEADIPYDKLLDMDEINGDLPQTDVALIIGANDVTNPAARTDASSPIFGMPILDVDKARTVMVIKRSMAAGFAGIDNPLYYLDKTLMLFGDAKGFRRLDRPRTFQRRQPRGVASILLERSTQRRTLTLAQQPVQQVGHLLKPMRPPVADIQAEREKLRASSGDMLHRSYFHVMGGLRYLAVHLCFLDGYSGAGDLDLVADVRGQVDGRRHDSNRLRSLLDVGEQVRVGFGTLLQTSGHAVYLGGRFLGPNT